MKTITPEEFQMKTVDFLTKFYRNKYQPYQLSSTISSQHPLSNSEIDILLNFNSPKQEGHTIIVESKSFSDLQSQLSFRNYKHPLLTLATIFGGIVAYFYIGLLPWYGILGITAVLLISLWGIIKMVQRLYREKRAKRIIDQLEKSPSNEKWIAITKPGIDFLKRKKSFSYLTAYNSLIKQSIKKNIGVLLVTKRKIQILQKPKFSKGYFLGQYILNNSTKDNPLIKKV